MVVNIIFGALIIAYAAFVIFGAIKKKGETRKNPETPDAHFAVAAVARPVKKKIKCLKPVVYLSG